MIKKFFSARKGFTIVELTIVIAVIAILAAVLIPTFVSLVKKANNSADVQMVTNINKYLAAMEATDGKNVTMHDAVKDAEDAGYKAAILTASNPDNTILWDMENDRFLVVDGKKIVAGLDEKKIDDTKMQNYWVVSLTLDEDTYSTYYIGKETNITLTGDLILGFDVGDVVVDLTYNRTANDVILNGVFKKLTVSGDGTPVVHGYVYELAGKVKADGAVFHNDDRSNVTATGNSVTFGICDNADEDDKCDFCNEDMCKHIWNVEVIQTAGCERIGLTKSTCTNGCNKEKYEVEPELGHDWKELEPIEPTCTTSGQAEGEVCLRCGEKHEGAILSPLLHEFDENEQCIHCKKYKDDIEKHIVDISSLSNIDWKDQDKQSQAIIVRLTCDISCTAGEFVDALGIGVAANFFVTDESGNVVVGGEKELAYSHIYAIDLDLNGHSLDITTGENSFGACVLGRLRIRDGKIVSKGKSYLGAMFNAYAQYAEITLNNVQVESEYNPLGAGYGSNVITVKNSSLLFTKEMTYQYDWIEWIGLDKTEINQFIANGEKVDESSKSINYSWTAKD